MRRSLNAEPLLAFARSPTTIVIVPRYSGAPERHFAARDERGTEQVICLPATSAGQTGSTDTESVGVVL
jgi:hypothetical protein